MNCIAPNPYFRIAIALQMSAKVFALISLLSAILAHASALFAGGKLSDEEQLAFIYELQTLYMKARQIIKDREDEQ